jgi:hypothetical protein
MEVQEPLVISTDEACVMLYVNFRSRPKDDRIKNHVPVHNPETGIVGIYPDKFNVQQFSMLFTELGVPGQQRLVRLATETYRQVFRSTAPMHGEPMLVHFPGVFRVFGQRARGHDRRSIHRLLEILTGFGCIRACPRRCSSSISARSPSRPQAQPTYRLRKRTTGCSD